MRKLYSMIFWCLWVSVVVIQLSGLNYANAAGGAEEDKKYGGEYRVPLDSEPVSLDPALYTDIYAMNVATNLFDGLVEFDKDLNIVPAISRVWKISRDFRTYVFKLREGVKFHNGREVTADDFVYAFTRILNPETQSPAASLFLNIRGSEAFRNGSSKSVAGLSAPDPYTLKIELEKPFAPFLSILAMANAKVVPREAVGPDFAKNPVGTGPFRFRSWEPGKEITLEANKGYFAGRPYLDFVQFGIYPNIEWERVFGEFGKGLLEQSLVPSDKYDLIMSDSGLKEKYTFISTPGLNLVYLGMNVTLKPFDDVRVRQAVYHAVDTEKIVREITRRGSVPAKGILPPGIPGFDPHFESYAYDPAKARQLLAESGYPEGRGIPPIEVWTVSKAESVQRELQAYQQFFANVGIQLVPKVAENWKEFIGLISENKVPMFYAAWYADFPDPDNFLYVLCHSASKTNRTRYHDAGVDHLLDQAREEMDYMNRVELYKTIEKRIMQDAPIIAQHVNSSNYLFQPWVKGVELSHLGAVYLPYRKVWIDHRQLAQRLAAK